MLLVDNLEKLGLSKREAEIYIALLKKKEFSAPELASITTVPRTKVYDILQNLENKGLCTSTQINNRKKYRAIGPKIAFQNVIFEYEKKLITKREIANQVGDELHSLFEKNTSENDPLEYIEVLKDIKQIRERWLGLLKNANKEILAFTKQPYSLPFSEDMDEEIDALKRNVKIRGVYEYKDIVKNDVLSVLSAWISAGEEVKIIEELPMKLFIIDEKITMLALNDPISFKPSMTTIIINHYSFAMAQKYVFESIWEKAMSFEEFKIKEKIS
ncbi:MAG: helix-turn-helix domain-containing protein [Candidatus Celaenobacter antarcticus]|nr:helix-turn-helix domain-containing protein [Candidatus Celaenobacter antarcticus]